MFRHRLDVKYGQSAQGKLRVTANEGIVGAAASSGQPVRVPDVTLDSRYIMVNPETRSELAIPMIHKGKVVGVLDLESPQTNYFTEDHVQTLMILAAQSGGVAGKRAAVRASGARRSAHGARTAPPRSACRTRCCVPCRRGRFRAGYHGADSFGARSLRRLVRFFSYGTQQVGIALGDVSGKGTAAALYGAVATGILRSLSPHKLQPSEMLLQLNQMVCDRRVDGRYMTICFATWQKARRKLRVANAGQTQPLLWKDGRVEQINLTGFPLGIFDDVTYDEWSVTLDPGDILVFHSDGISETSNSEGQFFGTEKLRLLIEQQNALSAAELADLIFREVEWFAQGAPLSDDRTLVVAKVR